MTQAQRQAAPAQAKEQADAHPILSMDFWTLMQGSVAFRGELIQHEDRILAFLDFPDIVASIEAAFPGSLPAGERAQKARKLIGECRLYVALADTKKLKPKLLSCTVESFVQAIGNCASVDLSLAKSLGQACLVPYGVCVAFQIMGAGFIELIYRTGAVVSIQPGVVYKGEYDNFVCKPGRLIDHTERPDCDHSDASIVCWYAEARMKDGPPVHATLNREEAEKLKRASKDPGGPWTQWYTEMGTVKVIRKLSKALPRSGNQAAMLALARALDLDNRDYTVDARQAVAAYREHGRTVFEQAAKTQVVDAPSPPPEPDRGEPGDKGPAGADLGFDPDEPAPLTWVQKFLTKTVPPKRGGETDVSDEAWAGGIASVEYGKPLDALTKGELNTLAADVTAGKYDPATGQRLP